VGAWPKGQVQLLFNEYSNWAKRYEWDIYAHLTFAKKTSYNLARGKFRKWIRAIEKNEDKRGKTSYYMSVEFNEAGAHIHTVGKEIEDIEFAKKWWTRRYGKCIIEPHNKGLDGIGYITKVVNIGGTPDPWGPVWKG